ncbi:MAG: hypothetical protein A2945_01240 [Candidatus Liptonbacteria bacterium RIFCSPLOWO2_01_FULL_52_25]|uniref:HIT domain-containing protein n=1 Tax=Candidatus Liptonbacteria bacterium RIFCSPLOWO2_01_FULL_52_25 TaxID=1798650 RepID=A0A1G2CDL5_9BACT|nr:MAG: hypothetical protein A2945_01240 [Candidatus Liptonbacteria bacterium RIFCSPLOWO2_01_FULL_52_25]
MPELRQDLLSGDWVLVAPGRASRPDQFIKKKPRRVPAPKAKCPFEDLRASGNWPPLVAYPNAERWEVVLLPNKYPALTHSSVCASPFRDGMYWAKTGIGSHNLLVTRDHNKGFADLDRKTALKVFDVLQYWHREAAKDKCTAYTASFFNWGPSAGASIWHPHYQILSLPIVPPHNARSLHNAEHYFKKHHRCVRCDIIKEERKRKKRIVAENKHAIAVVPYAVKKPFEVSVLPKKHFPYFWKTPREVTRDVAFLLQAVLKKMKKNLHDPDLNFFVHDAPANHGKYGYHHWHIEVIPKVSIEAGFELSTGIDINVVEPETAVKVLRK